MNTSAKLPNNQWLYLWRKLHTLRLQPLPTEEDVNQVLNHLPERLENENIMQWVKRSQANSFAQLLSFSKFRVTKLTELRLKAASDGKEEFPLPERPMVTPNGAFRLTITKEDEMLKVHLKTLAFATEKYRKRSIGIAKSNDLNGLGLRIDLDGNGEGSCIVLDKDEVRKLLCVHLDFVLIESDDV